MRPPSSRHILRSRTLLVALPLACAALAGGCSGHKDPEPLPPQTVTQVTPQLEAPPLPAPPIREVPASRGSAVKVIEEGGGDGKPPSLIEASRRARRQKEQASEPIAEITDENLHEYAAGADVIILESAPAGGALPAASTAPAPADGSEPHDEAYWRKTALELRMGWRRTVDRIQELQLESAALRQQFYAEEEPYIRDTQIKPAWDRVLDRLEALRNDAVHYESELESLLARGRDEGALPGWLREGWELEPTEEERDRIEQLTVQEPVEPQTTNHAINPGEGGP